MFLVYWHLSMQLGEAVIYGNLLGVFTPEMLS